ncbi:MAG: M20/M25/M40 family metallo-hydrolase [Bacteroidales bacterium]|nr:M20/M25/M40 family metallo-hydrolase [Bacteroidales bacterium]
MKKVLLIIFLINSLYIHTIQGQKPVLVNTDSVITEVLGNINSDSVQFYIQQMQDFDTRFALSDNRKNVALWLKQMFTDWGYTNAHLDSFLLDSIEWPWGSGIFNSTWQYNVVAHLEGQSGSDQMCLLGAHYDAIVNPGDAFVFTPGADDNASGVASVLETARVFKLHNITPIHKIEFVCFAAEELYLHGSAYHVNKLAAQNTNVKLMINNDMIAHTLEAPLQRHFKIQKYPGTEWVEELINESAQEYSNITSVVDSSSIEYSDSYPFYLQGYDAVFLQEYDFYNLFHTENDIIDSLDMSYCSEIIKIAAAVLLKMNIPSQISEFDTFNSCQIRVYPNPVTDLISINATFDKPQHTETYIYDITGRCLFSSSSFVEKDYHLTVDLKDYRSGVYYCIIKTEEHIIQHKFIKI